jgi:D-alanyl-D-alanine carboxypeptidase
MKIFYIFIFLIYSLSLNGQNIPFNLKKQWDRSLDSMRNVLGVKSLGGACQLSDNAIWATSVGISSLVPRVDVTSNDAYNIGSVTKTLTAAVMLQFADEGKLNLDDSIGKYLENMNFVNSKITIRQMLRHQSGLNDIFAHPNFGQILMADQSKIWRPRELISRFLRTPKFQPGTTWDYCNTNYLLCDLIMEKITGNPYYVEIRKRFIDPIGLNSFAAPAFELLTTPVAHAWLDLNGDGIPDDADNFYMNYTALNSTAGASGSYFATPTDLTRWTRKYFRGDLVSASKMDEAKVTVSAPGLPGATYGLGLNRKTFMNEIGWGHGGDLVYSANSWYFPKYDMSITILCNDFKNASWTSWNLVAVVNVLMRDYQRFLQTTSANDLSTGIKSFKAYPMPFSEEFSIEFEHEKELKDIKLRLTDILGREIKEISIGHSSFVSSTWKMENLHNIPQGIYLLSVTKDGIPIKTIKLVK